MKTIEQRLAELEYERDMRKISYRIDKLNADYILNRVSNMEDDVNMLVEFYKGEIE